MKTADDYANQIEDLRKAHKARVDHLVTEKGMTSEEAVKTDEIQQALKKIHDARAEAREAHPTDGRFHEKP